MSILHGVKFIDTSENVVAFKNVDGKPRVCSTPTDDLGFTADCTPNSELITTDKIRLVGTIFNGFGVDTNFWTTAVSSGTVSQVNSELTLTSGTTSGQYASIYTVRRATWVTGTSNKFRSQMRFGDTGTANVTRRWGVGWGASLPTITDGAYFALAGTAFSVNTMAGTSENQIASGSFNGTYSSPTLTTNNTYEILYTLGKVYFLINNVLIHTVNASTSHWTANTVNFHAFADVTNTGDSAAVTNTFRMINISRLGNFQTLPQYRYITGTTSNQILKVGGGIIHEVMVGTPQNSKTVSIYDNTAGTGNTIGVITHPTSGEPFTVDFNCPFFNGLNVTLNDAGIKCTVVYE